jgi:hypothetical protein
MATVFVCRIPSAASEIVDALLSAFAFDVVMRALFLVLHKDSPIAQMTACALASSARRPLARRLYDTFAQLDELQSLALEDGQEGSGRDEPKRPDEPNWDKKARGRQVLPASTVCRPPFRQPRLWACPE